MAQAQAAMSGQSNDPVAINAAARRALIPGPRTQTVRRYQQVQQQISTQYVAGQQLTLNYIPLPAGIITRFMIKVQASVGIGAAETQTRVQNGAAAILSNVQFVDTSNQNRVNVPGWYLNMLSTIRRRRQFAAALTSDINSVAGLGANYTPIICAAPASLTAAPPAANAPNLAQFYEVPIAYGKDDLRGAVLAGLVNSSMQLSVTINPTFFVSSTDVVNIAEAGYQSSSAQLGRISNVTVTLYQEYIDNIGGLALPQIDLQTQYQLQVSPGWQLAQGADTSIPYANYSLFMSTIIRYNNTGVFQAADINYMTIRTANQSDLVKYDPANSTLHTREHMGTDLPVGYYLMDHRQKPIWTNTYGNMSLIVNAASVTSATSQVTVGYEQLRPMNSIPAAGAIASGG